MEKLFIGRKVRGLRENARATQAQFAERLGISGSYLNQIENNQRPVSASVLVTLVEKFQLDVTELATGENDRLVGMLSDRDITIRAVARGLAPDRAKVREVMTTDVKYVYDDESVDDVSRNMSSLQVRRLPVLNREKRLVGIVSLGDLALKEPEPAGAALRSISEHSHH